MVKSLFMTLVYCPGLTCIQDGWQYHSIVDFQLGVQLDSITLAFARSFPNATLAFAILAVTSPSVCTAMKRVLPRTAAPTCFKSPVAMGKWRSDE